MNLLCLLFACTVPLLSFSYGSQGCDDDQLLLFSGQFRMGTGFALPGGGVFPKTDFWLRGVSLSYFSSSGWALVGHWGPNGDVVSPVVPAGQTGTIVYDKDAAPLFTQGEYFDVHSTCKSDPASWAYVTFWYVPK